MQDPVAHPTLCLVTDRRVCQPRDLVEVVVEAVRGGVTLVQVREKDLPAGELYELARRLRVAVGDRARVVVNDRLDVALVAGADGVHLPADGLSVEVARRLAPAGFLIGRSVHRPEEAVAAEQAGADYVVLGTIFATASHPGLTPAGPGLIAATGAICRLPILAIGGITAENAGAAIVAGAAGVAVISAILAADDPAKAAARMAAAIREQRMITLTVNGKERTLPGETPFPAYLEELGINPHTIAVEHNGAIVRREQFGDLMLRAGDRIEILRMIGGG